MQGDNPKDPIWMSYVPAKIKFTHVLLVTGISVAPVALAILMQKPALRQAIIMRVCHTGRNTCERITTKSLSLQLWFNQEYQKAQL